MKKKILVPFMALALAVTAGVNYNLIGSEMGFFKSNLADFCKVSIAQAGWEFDESNFVRSIWDQTYTRGYDFDGNPILGTRTICEGQGWLYCPVYGEKPY